MLLVNCGSVEVRLSAQVRRSGVKCGTFRIEVGRYTLPITGILERYFCGTDITVTEKLKYLFQFNDT